MPTQGWYNYEDTPGNFLLVPPRNTLPGVNAGTSDFLGVYTAIAPARITQADGCVIEPVAGTWHSPAAIAAWFEKQANLDTSSPRSVSIGGLRGLVIDLRTKPGTELARCTVDSQRIRLAGVFTGMPPTSLDHAVIPGMTMRLFLLSAAGDVLAIELDDIDRAPGDMSTLTRVARRLQFGS